MINNDNTSLEEILQIINSHKIKSNSLKKYFLRNLNQEDSTRQILSYLGELEYDLETINNLISNFQIHYCNLIQNLKESSLKQNNFNNEIKRLKDYLNKVNNEIIGLRKENNSLKNKENGNTITFGAKKSDNNYEENNYYINNKSCNSYRNYLNYNSCKTSQNNNNNNLYEINNEFDYKKYGRKTYTRDNNGNYKVSITNNNYNNLINKKIIDKKNNRNNKVINNNIINKIVNNFNKNNDIENNKNGNDNISYISDNKNINNPNMSNGLINNEKNNNSFNVHDIINKNIKDKLNNNNKVNRMNYLNLNNNLSKNNNDMNTNLNDNIYNYYTDNKENYLTEIKCSFPRDNYTSYDIPKTQSVIMNSKRLLQKNPYQNKSFNKRISEIPRVKNNKINRINNILSVVSGDENKYDMLKSIFGNNIQAQLLNGDINDDYLEKIENAIFYMGDNKSIIPMSKRFQIQKRAKSNSAKKPNYYLTNKKNRILRQKLRDKKLNNSNRKKWNTSKNFFINK